MRGDRTDVVCILAGGRHGTLFAKLARFAPRPPAEEQVDKWVLGTRAARSAKDDKT